MSHFLDLTSISALTIHAAMDLSSRKVEAISGLSAGFITTIVMHPLDLIKVRLQLSSQTTSKPFALVRSIIHKIRQDALIEAHPENSAKKPKSSLLLRQLYRGIGPNLAGNLTAWSLYFLLYAEFKLHLSENSLLPQSTFHYLGASSMAGITTSLLTNPLWVLKTRILGKSRYESGAYQSVMEAVTKMLKNEGVSSFWKGSVPSMFAVAQGSLQFTFYDRIKDMHRTNQEVPSQLSTFQYVYASAASKVMSMLIMYPTQVIRSRLQDYNPHHERRTISTICKKIYHETGWVGFYRGISANMLRVVPATCITFVSYEGVKAALQKKRFN